MNTKKILNLLSSVCLFAVIVGLPTIFGVLHPSKAYAVCNVSFCGPDGDIPQCPCGTVGLPDGCPGCLVTNTPTTVSTSTVPTPEATPTPTPTIPCVAINSTGYRPVCGFGPSPGYPVICLIQWAACVQTPGADLLACVDQKCQCNDAGLAAYCPLVSTLTYTPLPTPFRTSTPLPTPYPPSPTVTKTFTHLEICEECRTDAAKNTAKAMTADVACKVAAKLVCLAANSENAEILLVPCVEAAEALCFANTLREYHGIIKETKECLRENGCQ